MTRSILKAYCNVGRLGILTKGNKGLCVHGLKIGWGWVMFAVFILNINKIIHLLITRFVVMAGRLHSFIMLNIFT